MNDDLVGFQRAFFRDRSFELGTSGDDADDSDYDRSRQLAEVWSEFATFERLQGNNENAKSYTKTAINILEKLIQDDAEDIQASKHCASNHHNLGTILLENDDYAQADIAFGRAVSLLEKLTTLQPDAPRFHHELSQTISDWGIVAILTNRPELAAERFQRSNKICAALVNENPTSEDFQNAYEKSQMLIRQLERQSQKAKSLVGCMAWVIIIGVIVTLVVVAITNVFASGEYASRQCTILSLGSGPVVGHLKTVGNS